MPSPFKKVIDKSKSQWIKDDVGPRIGPYYPKGSKDPMPDPYIEAYKSDAAPARFRGEQMSVSRHIAPRNLSGPPGFHDLSVSGDDPAGAQRALMAARSKAGRVKPPAKGGSIVTKGPPSKTGLEDGLFSPAIHWHSFGAPDATKYAQSQPQEGRKLGFLSHDAKRRDEFSNNTRICQWRTQLKAEGKIATKTLEATIAATGMSKQDFLASSRLAASQTITKRTFARPTQFDRLSDDRDDPYQTLTLHSPQRSINRGAMSTSAQAYGFGVDVSPIRKPAHKRVSVTKEFFRTNGVTISQS